MALSNPKRISRILCFLSFIFLLVFYNTFVNQYFLSSYCFSWISFLNSNSNPIRADHNSIFPYPAPPLSTFPLPSYLLSNPTTMSISVYPSLNFSLNILFFPFIIYFSSNFKPYNHVSLPVSLPLSLSLVVSKPINPSYHSILWHQTSQFPTP